MFSRLIPSPNWGPTGDPNPSPAVTNRNAVLGFFEKVRTRRGTILGMMDSNHNYNSYGWMQGIGLNLSRRYGLWGSCVLPGDVYPAADGVGFGKQGTEMKWLLGTVGGTGTVATDLFATTHDITTGQELYPVWVSETCGLTLNTVYYAAKQGASSIRLYDTLAHAIADDGATGLMDITGTGATVSVAFRRCHFGNMTDANLASGLYVPSCAPSATDQVNNVLTMPGVHGFANADMVKFSATAGGITAGTIYYVKVGDEADASPTFKLRLFAEAALTNIIDLTADITAELSAVVDKSAHASYVSCRDSTTGFLYCDQPRYCVNYRTFATGANGSLKPEWKITTSMFPTQTGVDTNTVTGTDGWAQATSTWYNSDVIESASATALTMTGHPFLTKDQVVLMPGGGGVTTNVKEGVQYFARSDSANAISLYDTSAHANTGGATGRLDMTGVAGTIRRYWVNGEASINKYATTTFQGRMIVSTRYVEAVGVNNGIAMGCWYGVGGAKSGDMLLRCRGATVTQARYLTELLAASANGPLLVYIQVGGNDRSGSVLAATVKTNVQAIIDWWKAGWAAAGAPESDLYFVLMLNHPQNTIDEAVNAPYHTAYTELAQENNQTASVNLSVITSTGEMYVQGATVWYDSGGDAHLTAVGYAELGARVVSALCG